LTIKNGAGLDGEEAGEEENALQVQHLDSQKPLADMQLRLW